MTAVRAFKKTRLIFLLTAAVLAPLILLRYLAMRTDSKQEKIKWATIIQRTIEKPVCRLKERPQDCNMENCFNYSKCPLSSKFIFYLYALDLNRSQVTTNKSSVEQPIKNPAVTVNLIHRTLAQNQYRVKDPAKACVFVTVVESCEVGNPSSFLLSSVHSKKQLELLGSNHIIWKHCPGKMASKKLFVSQTVPAKQTQKPSLTFNKAILVSEYFEPKYFRRGFDIVLSSTSAIETSEKNLKESWKFLPPLFPIKRKYLAAYIGTPTTPTIQDALQELQKQQPALFVFEFDCHNNASNNNVLQNCKNKSNSQNILRSSTFLVILVQDGKTNTDRNIQLQLFQSLKEGSIPLVIGSGFVPPFNEVLDWSKILLALPVSRIPEIPYLLNSFTDLDIFEYRNNGRKFFQKYFSSVTNVVDTLLATVRTRIGMLPLPFSNSEATGIYLETSSAALNNADDVLPGIVNTSKSSLTWASNFSMVTLQKHNYWNSYLLPFNSLPNNVWNLALPSKQKFVNFSSTPLWSTEPYFSRPLGGNYPSEQFTIVILTYNRENVLLDALKKLKGISFLHKVVVVWNSPNFPSPKFVWPDIGVEIHVIFMKINSLNNRFIPFDAIETEAILSMDDDVILNNVEILFTFRIWRENRDQIVGFPSRHHRWREKSRDWSYISGKCESSLVLLGAAFFHKMYSYLYTYEMPAVIREYVTTYMNCEDIAFNFLVSYITRKPPVRVTAKSGFGCASCKTNLHLRGSHYTRRQQCLSFFSEVYGFTQLLNTQFRAETILPLKVFPQDIYNCSKPNDELEG